MAARSRAAFREEVIGLKNGSGRSPIRREPLLLRSSSAAGNLSRLVTRENAYLQSMLKLSWNTVSVPLALKVTCKTSCTRKLLPEPWPIILKLLTYVWVNCPFWKETLKLEAFVTPVA